MEDGPAGSLVVRKTARDVNPDMATAAKLTVVEVAGIVAPGNFDPDGLHVPTDAPPTME